ncbi:hypothetical protein BEN74_04615 [Acinetobacter sp. WCHAc010034]|uniref:hypothetical protein n=1 Tax=Acinetobacter sp. WCHAc010034 TaxID=1879049 RepID=UPI00083A5820|nr:hypothetical protein [Acinetobacter sp. WCHAc010034]AYA02223.1 hypothetical protein BEN74_04615 [Acinetobacter sp. WCHAc010034]
MSVNTSLEAGLAGIHAHTIFLDSGSQNATIAFFSGAKPAAVSDPADDSQKLVTLTFPKPCFKATGIDYIELHQTDAALVTKAGTATWARVFSGDAKGYIDISIGDGISLANPDLALGSTLMVNSFKLRPAI